MLRVESKIIQVDSQLDSEENKVILEEIFGSQFEFRVLGKYSAEPKDIIIAVVIGLVTNALWDTVKLCFVKLAEFASRTTVHQQENIRLLGVVKFEAHNITYEITHELSRALTDYHAGVIINSVDLADFPEDTARVAINLRENYVKAFDEDGLHIVTKAFKG